MNVVSFATLEDLNMRLDKPLTGAAATKANTLLVDASAKLQLELERSGIRWLERWEAQGVYAAALRSVTCSMVERAIETPLPLGVSSQQQTAGPYSNTFSAANPGGDVYILASERRTLGIGDGRIRYLMPHRAGR